MIRGTLIAESLRLNDPLDAVPLLVQDQLRWIVADLPDSQPTIWTLLAFTADESLAEELADALAGVLDPAPGWYCDFRTKTETLVVFSGRVFCYRRRDNAGRERAVMFCEKHRDP